jgi:hypothetical protein
LDLTPIEINWKVEAYNRKNRQRDQDLYDLGSLVVIGVNNPKQFPKSLQKFRPVQTTAKNNDREMKRQAGIIGARIPQ